MFYILVFIICSFTLGYQDSWEATAGILLLAYVSCAEHNRYKASIKMAEECAEKRLKQSRDVTGSWE